MADNFISYNGNEAYLDSHFVNAAQNGNYNQQIAKVLQDRGYGFTDTGLAYLMDSGDSFVNAVNQGKIWQREDVLRKLAEQREDTSLDRIIKAAERNGINPIFLLDALSGNTGTAASYSTSAAKTNNYDTNAKTAQANSARVFGALIAAIGMIIGHLL